ncbi:MAG: pyruvate kinase [Pseudomonadota bacterium]
MGQELTRLRYRRTRILATLGPASDSSEMIGRLLDAGVDVVRLNMSHGEHATHARVYQRVREEAARRGRHVAVLADLCGPKIRVGTFADGGIDLIPGEELMVTTRAVQGEPGLVHSQYAGLPTDVEVGHRLLLADGLMTLEVLAIEEEDVRCRIVHGGRLTERKGINLPDSTVSAQCLTEKDLRDLEFAVGLGVDFVALSFVRTAADVIELRQRLDAHGSAARIVAKIERPEAVSGIDAILDHTDAIMVARGDLGVELPPEAVPVAQQHLVDRARARHQPVIVATQMLESMIDNPRPTRAEVTDVAHSVNLGADAVMLSAESAAGSYPREAVAMMDRIAREAEAYLWTHGQFGQLQQTLDDGDELGYAHAVGRATAQLSRDLMVRAIFVVSRTGFSGRAMSGERPAAPIILLAADEQALRRSALLWGTLPVACDAAELDDPVPRIRTLASELGLAEAGQTVLMVRGFDTEAVSNLPSVTLIHV